MVERAALVRTIAWSQYRSRTRRAIGAVAGVGQRADDRGRGASDPAECESGCAIWVSGADDRYRVALGTRCEPPPDRTPEETGGYVECPRFPPSRPAEGDPKPKDLATNTLRNGRVSQVANDLPSAFGSTASASTAWRTLQRREGRGGIVAIGGVQGIIRIVLVGRIARCVDTALHVSR